MGLFLAATVMSSQATTIIVTVSNVPPVYEGESILITGSALYSELLYPVSGAATTVTLGGETSNTHTIAGGTYSVSMGPLSAGEYSACVYITDTSVEGSNCLAISVLAVASNQTITFPAIADQLSTHTVELTATASSGLPVSFTVAAGPAQITNETTLTFTGTGSVSIVASQSGNSSWNPAPAVTNSFSVSSPPLPLEITTTALPSGTAGSSYNATLQATNGVPPYSWSSGTLPSGLSCTSNGVISGTPTQAGSNLVTFTVQDSVAATTNREIGIVIQAAPYSGDRYVSPNGNNTPPYSNWVTAAHTIQDAVNAASSGTCVWVSNGIYTNGMHDMSGVFTSNRVVIDKTIRVESLNGPEFTIIGGNGESEPHLRCVYLAAGATLSGFTIENGFADVVVESVTTNGETVFAEGVQTNFGGGVLAEDQTAVVTNCLFIGNRVNGDGGAFYGGSGFNCTFLSNSAITFNGSSSLDNPTTKGGATRYAALNNCTALWNTCSHGGALADGSAANCTLISNSATFTGGGALDTDAENCEFAWNSAQDGGGLHGGSALRCTFTGNGAGWGAGAHNAALTYCHLTQNSAYHSGGGSYSGGSTGSTYTANFAVNGGGAWAGIHTHSTFTKNTADNGILREAWAYNCLVYDNSAANLNLYDDGEVTSIQAFEGGWKNPGAEPHIMRRDSPLHGAWPPTPSASVPATAPIPSPWILMGSLTVHRQRLAPMNLILQTAQAPSASTSVPHPPRSFPKPKFA